MTLFEYNKKLSTLNTKNATVDFFDDNLGSHTGFVPKTDLVSRYHQFIKGNVVAERAGERTNTKTRNAYGQDGEYNEPSIQEFLEENKPRSVRKCKPF